MSGIGAVVGQSGAHDLRQHDVGRRRQVAAEVGQLFQKLESGATVMEEDLLAGLVDRFQRGAFGRSTPKKDLDSARTPMSGN